ncbi:hypothetical protein NQZ68_002037 [Dissostichus eleginoides]|nr:hypothetical protein NQZ68_002037 [Dissostichus eleginoides]
MGSHKWKEWIAPSQETAHCEPDGFTALRMNCWLDRGQNSLEHELNALFPGQQPTQYSSLE